MAKIICILIALLIFAVGNTLSVSACSCIPPSGPTESLEDAAAVFLGTVTTIDGPLVSTSSLDPITVTFDIDRVWKGTVTNNLHVTTAMSSASCGYEFTEGEQYIVYAQEGDDGLMVSLCSRTALLAAAEEDLAELGEGQIAPEREPVLIDPLESGKSISANTYLLIGIIIILLTLIFLIVKSKKK